MSVRTEADRHYGFMIGLAAGTVVGAGLAIWLAPKAASELRERVTASARRVGADATRRYRNANARASAVVARVTAAGQEARDGIADAVVRGAQSAERHATAAKTNRSPKSDSDDAPVE